MKNRKFRFFRMQWLLIWVLVVSAGLISNIAFAEYGTQSSYMKRVVVSTSDQGMMFSSNFLTEGGNKVYQAKYFNGSQTSYPVDVYIWNFSTKNSVQTYPDDIEYTMAYQVTDPSGTAISDIGSKTITITKPDNTTVQLTGTRVSGNFDWTFDKDTDTENKYTVTYGNWNLDADSNICLQLIAKPKKSGGRYSDLRDIGGIIGLKTDTGSTGGGWEAYISEINDNIGVGYVDGYNLVVTGSGKASVTIRWKDAKIDINKFFKESPVDTGDVTEVSAVAAELDEYSQPTGWKYITITADAAVRNRYNIQLYLKDGRPEDHGFFKEKSEADGDTWVTYEITNTSAG